MASRYIPGTALSFESMQEFIEWLAYAPESITFHYISGSLEGFRVMVAERQ